MTERGFHPFAVLHFLRKTILLYLLPLLQVLFARNWAALRTALVQGAALLLGALMATAFFGMDVLLAVSPFLLIPEGILIGISFFKKAPS